MKRYSFWRDALFHYVQGVARKPFAWGDHDPPLFVAGAVAAMTGVDLAAEYRGRYRTMLGGLRKLKTMGFATPVDQIAAKFEEIHQSKAQVGDIALVEKDDDIGLGIVQGPRIYVLRPGAAGIGTVGLLDAKRAFLVPFKEELHHE